jgi:hypothetical protein
VSTKEEVRKQTIQEAASFHEQEYSELGIIVYDSEGDSTEQEYGFPNTRIEPGN